MRLIANIVLITLFSYYAEWYLPWWIVCIVSALICGIIHVGLLRAFISGFLSIGGLWFLLAWQTHVETKGVLSEKITSLLELSDPMNLVMFTGLVGGLVSGISAMSGSAIRGIYRGRALRRGPYQ